MNRGKRLAIVSAILLMGLVLYAAFPLAAHADSSTPQPPPPADTSTPAPDGSGGGGSGPAPATAVAVQPIAPNVSGSSSTGSSTTGTTSLSGSSDTTASGSSVVPAGTSVVPLDSSGNPVPLATATAATILGTGDPIWCPSGAAPSAGSNGCTGSYSNLASLVSGLSGASQPTQNGTIWITNGADSSGGAIAMNGGTLATWATHALTIQGGWDGTNAGHIVGQTSFTNVTLGISNWGNDISLNDLLFDGGGVSVQTSGNINVNDVEVRHATATGLALTNISGLSTTTTNVSNSNFHNNTGAGLTVNSLTRITLSNVTASSNGTFGALMSTNGAVTIDEGVFSQNGLNGINVGSGGDTTVRYATVDSNGQYGAVLVSSSGDINSDHSQFNGNKNDGLLAIAAGSIDLNNIAAQNNDSTSPTGAGAYLQAGTNGDVTIDSGLFTGNSYDGLYATAGNSITLSQVTANNNQSLGFTNAATFLSTIGGGDISIDNSTFSGNGSDGLNATAGGSINLVNVGVNQNQTTNHIQAAANLNATNGNITVQNGTFNANRFDALRAQTSSTASIDLSGVTANSNEAGGHLFAAAYLTSGSVTIGSSAFDDNKWTGLRVTSAGPIDVGNTTANGNGNIGAKLSAGGDISSAQSTYSGNAVDGLDANAAGDILLNNVSVVGNEWFGGIAGANLFAGGDILITNNSAFSGNTLDGLNASANGNISLDAVTANGNNVSGLGVAGTQLTSGMFGNISINNAVFNDNSLDALYAIAGNSLTLSSVTANSNQKISSSKAGTWLSASGPVTITNGTFDTNNQDGLWVEAIGGVTLRGVAADRNEAGGTGIAGARLNAQGPINISDSSFSNNKWDGLDAVTTDSITLKNVTANGNNFSGVTKAGTYLEAGGDVTIDPSSFSYNKNIGLAILAGGNVSTSGLQINNNGSDGVDLTAGLNANSLCDSFVGNSGTGLDAFLPGTLGLTGDFFQGNATAYSLGGGGTVGIGESTCEKTKYKTPTPKPQYNLGPTAAATPKAAPQLNVLNVTDGQTVNLDCTNYSGTTLALSNRDQIVLLCPITGQGVLKHVSVDTLPAKLDTSLTYQSAMDAEVTQNGQALQTLSGPMKVDFVIPSGASGTTKLSIMHWDGTQYVDVGGTATPDGFIETITNQTGTFVLVSH